MTLKLKINGLLEDVVNGVVESGVAKNRNEAINKIILHYGECFNIRPKR